MAGYLDLAMRVFSGFMACGDDQKCEECPYEEYHKDIHDYECLKIALKDESKLLDIMKALDEMNLEVSV